MTKEELEIYTNKLVQAIYERRLIVILETDPQTNKYQQVKLNAEQFRLVSFGIEGINPLNPLLPHQVDKHGMIIRTSQLRLNNDIIDLSKDKRMENIRSISL